MKRFFLYIYVCLVALFCEAQQVNVIKVPDIAALADHETSLCVYLSNTSNDIVAMQMDLLLPQGITVDASSAILSDRASDHVLQVKPTNGGYRFMVYSPTNQPFRGNRGLLLTVNARLDDHFLSDNEYSMSIDRATLGDRDGNNVLTSTECGNIKIQPSPDFVVTTLAASPQKLSPEGEIMLSWTVKNQGIVPSTGGWSEQILIVDDNGGKILLGKTYFNESLQASETVSRQATIKIPRLPGLEGNMKAQIQLSPNSDSGERPEYQTNNTTIGDDVLFLSKSLFVEMPTSVTESNRTIACKLMRSGSRQGEESFRLTLKGDNRVTAPKTVTIAKGSSSAVFNLVLSDNDVLDNDSIIGISIEGNDYPAIHQQLVIEDNEYPDFTLSTSKLVVNEGEIFQLTVTTSRVSKQPIAVTLYSENTKRFTFPQTVTIPAGKKSVTVDVTAVDDELPSLVLSNTFTASAPKYNKGEVIVLLQDNDLPVLEMTLTPTTVSESAGVVAVSGVLCRKTHTDSKITVKLTDDANGGLYFGNRTLTLDKGVQEVHFNFGPVDNVQVDGDRTYNITAAVWISSCGCGASGESAGYTTTQLQVLDNDGAALSLSSSASTLKEGGKTTLTISRNTDTTSALTVTLNSDYSEGLTYPTTVTIPAGQQSTTVEVTSSGNNVQGDSHNVIFTVQSDGHAKGTCFITITDQTKPDAVISALRVNSYDIEVGEKVSLSVVVVNKGVATLPSHTAVNFGCSGNSKRETLYTPADLAVGDSVVLISDYILPVTVTGTYTLTATVNPDQHVTELNYNNNTLSSATITVRPNFTATVTVDCQKYHQGETVTISGQTSAGGHNANVEVFLINNGTRQSLTLKADEEGRFQTTYKPYDRQAGHFVVGACYPGTGETSGSAEFDVYGLLLSAAYATHDISIGDEVKGSFVIKNPGLLPQTGMRIEQTAESNGCDFTFGQISSIDADGQIEVSYSLKANEVTQGNDWLQVPLLIHSNEGCTQTFTVYYYIRSLKGKLKASQTHIETTMTKGTPREYQLQVSNIGRGETGTISLSLPSWIESVTPRELPSISQSDTVTIVLRMVPTDNMQLNVPITGQIGINCKNGDGVAVALNVTPVSEETGSLVIDVVDEYTYYAEGSPHVVGARVLVKHPTTGRVIAQGQTGTDGRYSLELPEGWYTVSINADKHQGYETTFEVAPGKETGKEIFLTYEAISYNWEVVETEVEDEYEIETVVKYETNVPKPVIVLSLPDEKPEVGSVIAVVATNKGLISAKNIDVMLSVNEGLELEWLTDPSLTELAPQQSATFYAVLKESEASQSRRRVPGENWGTCISIYSKIRGYYLCGDFVKALDAEKSRSWGDCLKTYFYTNGGSGGGSGGGWTGGGGSTGGSHPGYSPNNEGNNTFSGSFVSGALSPTVNLCHEKEKKEVVLPPALLPDPERCKAEIDDYALYSVEVDPVIGVAADGVSKVNIYLSGARPLTMNEADEMELSISCTQIPKWTLNENIGTLIGADTWEPTYIAPPDFPGDDNDVSYTVTAVVHYNVENGTEDTYEVPIKITRAPLALIHGLWSSSSAWEDFADAITTHQSGGGSWARSSVPVEQTLGGVGKMYEDYQVLCVDYSGSHFRHFSHNVGAVNNVVQDAIDNLKEKYLEHGIVAEKADLIGHSMGGVLARLHVQNDPRGSANVHKLITLNTPHSGSPVANFINSLPKKARAAVYGAILADTYLLNDGEFNLHALLQADGALLDLAVGSVGTDDYLNDSYNLNSEYLTRMNGVPIHAISSYFDDDNADLYSRIITGLIAGVNITKDIEDIVEMFEPQPNIFKAIKKGFDGIKTLCNLRKELEEDFYMGKDLADALYLSDGVVPYESETGGLGERNGLKTFCGGFEFHHISVTENEEVWTHLKKLLNASVKDKELFCMTGWKPIKIEYTTHTQNSRRAKVSRQLSVEDNPDIQLNVVNDSLHVQIKGMDSPVVLVRFNDSAEAVCENDFMLLIPSTHYGDIKVYTFVCWNDESMVCDSISINIPAPRTAPMQIFCKQLCQVFVDKPFKIRLECLWADGSKTRVIPDEVTFTDDLAYYENGYITGLHGGSGTATFTYQGLTCEAPFTVYNFGKKDDEESSKSVCSTITLKLSQTMTMTRQAFRGTLTMINGNEAMSMKDVKLALKVTNVATGEEASSHEFQINAESIDGFTGEIDLASGWTLAGNRTGTATILFIPTKYAAPTEPVEWSFGGTLSYLDPFTGLVVTRDLYPVTLTVKPSPELDLTYFMQRDIYGDDPLTEAAEPMVPAEFSLLINNIGNGDATNVRMMTNQPQIIENEKGLAINFELLSSQLNGGDKTLALGGSVATDFGTIPAHTQSYAQWWLQSSLLGHFTEYDVKATHVTSYGNPDLSLLNDVSIHELIRSIKVGNGNVTGFVANDIPDTEDTPDIVYFTDGTTADVIVAANAEWQKLSSTEYMLTIMPSKTGWNYGHVTDPTIGRAKLISIHRQSDDKEINLRNFWQTDRTLRDGKDWLYENRLHFVDDFKTEAPVTYLLTFDPVPMEELKVEGFAGLPEDGTVLTKQLNELTVKFNKPIKADSFTTEDIIINCQGIRQDVSQIVIEKVNEQEYRLKLNEVTLGDGYYVLTIQTAGIEDGEGFNGSTGKQAAWIQFVDGKVALIVKASPVEGGTVTPENGRFDYDSDIMLQATPAEGYEFVKWMYGEESISNNPEFMYHLYSNSELTALFSKKHYSVDICYDSTQGLVEGASSGIYDYGTQLQLVAVPKDGYGFDAWTIDAERDNQTNPYVLVVNRNMIINALFKEEDTGIHHIDSDELKVLISPLPLRDVMYITGNFQVVRNLSIYNMNGVKVLARDNIQSNQAIDVGKFNAGIYLVQVVTDRGIYRTKILKR